MRAYLPTAERSPAPLSASIGEACRHFAQRPAVTFDGATLTYAEVGRQIASLAAAYRKLGVGRGDRVFCQLRNCPEQVIAIAAAWMCGAIHVGADNDLTGPELVRLVERLQPRVLLFQPRQTDMDALGPLRLITSGAFPKTAVIVHGRTIGDNESLASLLARSETAEAAPPGPLDPAVIFLTSGTTGEPKAVIEWFSSHWAKMQLFTDAVQPAPDDVMLLTLPVSHVFGVRLAILTLLRGARLVLHDRFSPQAVLETVRSERVTLLPAVPTHLRLLRDGYDASRHDLSSLRWVISAAANLPRSLAEWVLDDLRAQLLFVYGCSEGFTTIATEPRDILDGTVGRVVFQGPAGTPAAGVVRIMDPSSGALLPDGDTGEIVYGASTPVKYWDQPEVAVDGWYHTGDLGVLDTEGRLHVTGRIKELVNRGGLHVSVSEVELAIARHPSIADAAVIGVPDRVLGEAVCACVVPHAAHEPPRLGELREWLAATLARHKLPDELCVVDAIPRTDIGKVDRRELAARVAAGDARERLRPD